jgi:hypothetical protein
MVPVAGLEPAVLGRLVVLLQNLEVDLRCPSAGPADDGLAWPGIDQDALPTRLSAKRGANSPIGCHKSHDPHMSSLRGHDLFSQRSGPPLRATPGANAGAWTPSTGSGEWRVRGGDQPLSGGKDLLPHHCGGVLEYRPRPALDVGLEVEVHKVACPPSPPSTPKRSGSSAGLGGPFGCGVGCRRCGRSLLHPTR